MKEESKKELKAKIKHIEKAYGAELKRKDKIIEELREQNELIFKTALKSSDKIDNLSKKLVKAMKKKSK